SDGQEELYRYSTDPNEFTNLADRSEFASQKAMLRSKLIALRDGSMWQELGELPERQLSAFELQAEVQGPGRISFGDQVVLESRAAEWTPIRIRLAGKRTQVWTNHRVLTDITHSSDLGAGRLTSSIKLRNLRIREL
ncbi:MAG: hypothetical protein AAF802_13535, partial [Planctomycetota bacterium]